VSHALLAALGCERAPPTEPRARARVRSTDVHPDARALAAVGCSAPVGRNPPIRALPTQELFTLDKPLVLGAGDNVITTCTYNNDTNNAVTFGENTGDEMCFNFALY
jgi:hypothetical protein